MSLKVASSLIGLLPVELICMVINFIGDDLVAHVGFLKSNDFVAACYSDRSAKFWEALLRGHGIGCLAGETREGEAWEALAIECVDHAEVCHHPACGFERLQDNVACMAKAVKAFDQDAVRYFKFHPQEGIAVWDIMNVSCNDNRWWGKQEDDRKIMEYITFKSTSGNPADPHDSVRDVVYLRDMSTYVSHGEKQFSDELTDHPVALRTFATFLPIPRMTLGSFAKLALENDRGITMGDLTNAILNQFNDELDEWTLRGILDTHEQPLLSMPDTWVKWIHSKTPLTVRDWFNRSRMVHLDRRNPHKSSLFFISWFQHVHNHIPSVHDRSLAEYLGFSNGRYEYPGAAE